MSCTCTVLLASCCFMCSISLIINWDDEGCREITEIKSGVWYHSIKFLFFIIFIWQMETWTCSTFLSFYRRVSDPPPVRTAAGLAALQRGVSADVSTPGQTLNLHFEDSRGGRRGGGEKWGCCVWREILMTRQEWGGSWRNSAPGTWAVRL